MPRLVLQVALHESMREARARAAAGNPTRFWLPPAAPAACVCGVRISTTVIQEYDVPRRELFICTTAALAPGYC